MIRLQTLGALDLTAGDGHPHPLLAQPKRLGLLVYLAAERQSKRRDTIMPLFWPELDHARARGALRQAVYVLRRELGDVIRLRGEDELGVDPAALWLDVDAFETAAEHGDWRTAAALYRGDFLDGFFIPGAAPDFDTWTTAQRARLRALASRVMWSAAEGPDAGADAGEAVGWIRRAIALAPDDELTLRRALRGLDRLGDRAGALQLYQEFRDRLHEEYDAEPSTETKVMAKTLRASREPTDVEVEAAANGNHGTLAGTQPAGAVASPVPEPAATPAPVGRRRTGGRAGMVAVAVAVAAAVSAWSYYRSGALRPLSSTGALVPTDQIVVGDIAARPTDSLSAHALTEVLRTKMAETRAVAVVSRAALDQSLQRMLLPITTRLDAAVVREIAERNGYKAVLTTELTPVGGSYVLSAHLTSRGGAELASASESAATADALIPAVGRLSRTLRSQIGETLHSAAASSPLDPVSTRSIRALELFTRSQDLSRAKGSQPPGMVELLREAIAADSTFAMAHRRLGMALYNLGYTGEAVRELRAAERFGDRLTPVERLMALSSLHGIVREPDRAIAEANEILRIEPGNIWARVQLGYQYFMSGQYEAVAQERRADGPLDGPNPFWSNWLAYAGREAEAVDSARVMYRRYEDSTESRVHRSTRMWLADFHAVNVAYDSAAHYAEPVGTTDPGSPFILAVSQFARGQFTQALVTQRRRTRASDSELAAPGAIAAVESFTAMATMTATGDRAAAGAHIDRALADSDYLSREPGDRHVRPILALAVIGRAVEARRALTAMELSAVGDVAAVRSLDLEYARGAVALAEHRTSDAIEAFRRASGSTAWGSSDACRVCALPWLGRAYEQAGQSDSATVVYERFLTTGDAFRMMADAVWRAPILARLGELHAQRGDTALATRRLSEFVELWKDADAPLAPRRTAATKRVARLVSRADHGRHD